MGSDFFFFFGCECGGKERFKKLADDDGFRGSKKCEYPFSLRDK